MKPGWTHYALVALLYFAGAKLGTLTLLPEGMAIVWPPNAVALAALLRFEGRGWPVFGAVVLGAELAADLPAFSAAEALLFGLVNFGEALLAWRLLGYVRFDPGFGALSDAWKFVLAGPLAAALAAALLGAAVYATLRGGQAGYAELVRTWWFGDGIGLLIATPLLLGFAPFRVRPESTRPRWRATAADGALLAAVAIAAAAFWFSSRFGTQLRPFIFIPLALAAAARYPQRWAPVAAAAVAVLVVLAMTRGLGPFGPLPAREAVIQAQGFIFITGLTTLGLAALLAQLRRHEGQLEALNATLEARVAERTRELRQANEALARLATLDPLTGVGNRRLFDETLESEVARARRYGGSLSLVIADLDHFKRINDTHGHAVGDEVLRRVGRVLWECARGADLVARYGGEEFAVILPQTTLEQAVQFAERARRALTALPAGVTASFGVAELGGAGEGARLVAAADAALYRAKARGRNQAVAAPPLGV